MLHSDRVRLRPVEQDDLAALAEWRNDPANYRWFFSTFPIALAGQQDWYRDLLRDSRRALFIVESLPDHTRIGTIGFDRIDWKNQRAELGNMLIGEPSSRRQGLATEAVQVLVTFGFRQMNLNRIALEVFDDNVAAIGVYERCGFRCEGILRQAYFRDGRAKDVRLMAVLRSESAF
jgi:RimJ/RimL family protein N-acetyltransferase